MRYAAAWVKNADGLAWKLHRNRTSSQYADAFKTYADQGLRSIVVDSARTSSGQRYAGIWIENRNKRGWYAYRDLTATGFRNHWNRLSDQGYRLDGYEKYDTASGARYAGIWRQNSDRPNWSLRSKVDGFVQKELDDFDVPGISVTASKNGKVVYRRGFGFQDKADGIWMHGGSVNRTASVSKAVAGVLALRMDAKHTEFSLADKVRTHLPWLPAKHDYTIEQAVMNRSCVKSYPSPMTSQNATQYDTAADSVKAFMADRPRLHAGLSTSTARTPTRCRRDLREVRGQADQPHRARRAHDEVRAEHAASRDAGGRPARPRPALQHEQHRVRGGQHVQQDARRRARLDGARTSSRSRTRSSTGRC